MSKGSYLSGDAQRWVRRLPKPLRDTIRGVTRGILSAYPDVLAAVIVGSVAEGAYDAHSDVDYLYLGAAPVPREVVVQLKSEWPLVNFIYCSPQRLDEHIAHCNTMAWSIQRGVVLFDRGMVTSCLRRRRLGPPSKDWIRSRFKEVQGWPSEGVDDYWRKFVNHAILYLELTGVVPTTKREIQHEFQTRISDSLLLEGMRLAMARARQKAELAPDQQQALRRAVLKLSREVRRLLIAP